MAQPEIHRAEIAARRRCSRGWEPGFPRLVLRARLARTGGIGWRYPLVRFAGKPNTSHVWYATVQWSEERGHPRLPSCVRVKRR